MSLRLQLGRLIPHERYRALLVGLVCGLLGYLSPPVIAALVDRWQFPIEAAQIEQLRHDSLLVPCAQSQQIMARVVEENILIARKQRENSLWYTDIFVSDRWNQVQLLEVPCRAAVAE